MQSLPWGIARIPVTFSPDTKPVYSLTRVWRLIICLLVTVSVLMGGELAFGGTVKTLAGHVPAAVGGLTSSGPLAAETNLYLAIGLPLRNKEALTNFLEDLYNPGSANFRHYLTPAQFADRFGPTVGEYQATIDFARSNGLEVLATHSNRMVVSVRAPVARIEKAFNLHLRRYPHPTEKREFFAPDAEPTVDAAVPMLDVMGLDNFIVPHRMDFQFQKLSAYTNQDYTPYAEVGSGPNGLFIGTDFRHAYVPGVTNTGTGQFIGLMEFGPYWTNDIHTYETTAGLPTNLAVMNVFLDGVTEPPSAGTDAGEQALDIEMCLCMAPGATVIYYGGNVVNDIIGRMASDNLAKQTSCSFGFGINSTTEQLYQEMVAQGQNYSQASGDAGAYVGQINPPAAEPYVMIVGGTALSTVTPNGAWQSENTWVGSGGGISTFFPMPAWQQGINMAPIHGSATMRNFPDVAMMADTSIFIAANNTTGGVGGTSCSSPLWTGFLALVNQQAAALGQPGVGFVNPAVYAIGKGPASIYTNCFHDITTGNTTNAASGPTKFFAAAGYDLCTGWGSPTGSNLINALVYTGTNNFMLFASPVTATIVQGGTAVILVNEIPMNGFNSGVNLSISGLPGAVSANFSQSPTTGSSLLTLTANSQAVVGAAALTVTGVSGNVTQNVGITLNVIAATPGTTPVGLSSYFNLTGVYNNGVTFSGGMDGSGNAYSASLLDSPLSWNGCLFNRGSPGVADAVKCTGQTITLPSGKYSSLQILAAAVGGAQTGQVFTVNYTDGTTSTYRQNISDWTYFQGNPGESQVQAMIYRNTSSGGQDTVTSPSVYGYSFGLNNTKTVQSVKVPGNGNVVILGMTLANDFTLFANPVAATLTDGGSATSFIAAAPLNGFTSAVSLSAIGLPTGVTATFSPASTTNSSIVTLRATATAPPTNAIVTLQGTMAGLTHTFTMNVTVLDAIPGTASVSLASAYNLNATYADGATFAGAGGFDGAGDAFSGNLLGTSVSWKGFLFSLGTMGALDAVKCAGQTVTLPAGQYPALLLLAAATAPGQTAQTFTVNYTDGTSSNFTQSVSSWITPQNYAGEAVAVAMAYNDASTGMANAGAPANLYGYLFALNDGKTVKSLGLPTNGNVVVFAAALGNAPLPVSLTGVYNRSGIYTDGTTYSGGGLDGGGFSFSATLLGPTPYWDSIPFNLGPSNTLNAISAAGQTINFPTNRFTSLFMLATGVQGSQAAQSFVVTYTDGTTATFTQSISDWANSSSFAGESVAVKMPYRNFSNGTANSTTVNIYGYFFPLNNTKAVKGIKLPTTANLEIFAFTLANLPLPAPLYTNFNRAGIYTDGTKFTNNAGLDNDGNALSATLLGPSLFWKGALMQFGQPNVTNVISAAGQTVALPAGQYGALLLLATAVNGGQTAQSFVVTYTNGATSTFSQSISDWANSSAYAGETIVAPMAYRAGSGGSPASPAVNLYGYSFALNASNVVQSLRLPANANVEIAAITLSNATFGVPEPPGIITQPQPVTATNGSPATFTVAAFGSPTLAYYWQRAGTNLANGGNVSGANSATLVLNPATLNDASGYQVIVSNAFGSVTSSAVLLTVVSPPLISVEPSDLTVTNGDPAGFSVTASGTAPLNYSWFVNGNLLADGGNVSGSATSNLALAAVTTNDAGSYLVILSNPYGSVTSSVANLTVMFPPVISAQPASVAVTNGGTALFSVTAAGGAPLTYQWLKNGTNLTDGGDIFGSATSQLTISPANPADAAVYSVFINSALGSVTSSVATLTVGIPAPAFQSVQQQGNQLVFTWSSVPGANYQVQYNTDLTTSNWINLGPVINATGATIQATDSIGPDVQRFYKVVVLP